MKNSIIILIFISVFGCTSDDGAVHDFEPSPIEFTTVSKGVITSVAENLTQNTVISTGDDFQQLVAQMEIYDPNLDMDIDFSEYWVIAVIGHSHSTGSAIEITGITEYQDSIKVYTYESLYDYTQPTAPYHLVQIPITPKPFVFYNTP